MSSVPFFSGLGSIFQGQDPNHEQSAGNADQLATNGAPNAGAYTGQNAALRGYGAQAGYIGQGGANHTMDYSSAQPGQNAQNDALGLSGQLARGQGPSLSRANMNLGLSQGVNNLASLSAGAGGMNQGGLGLRNLLNAGAAMQGQAAGQGAVAGAAEQIGNIQNYGALGSAARGQGLQQAGMDSTNAHANTSQQLSGLGLGANISNSITGNNIGADQARTGHATDVYNAQNGVIAGDRTSNNAWIDRGINGVKAAASAVGGMPSFGGGGGSAQQGVEQGYLLNGEGTKQWGQNGQY